MRKMILLAGVVLTAGLLGPTLPANAANTVPTVGAGVAVMHGVQFFSYLGGGSACSDMDSSSTDLTGLVLVPPPVVPAAQLGPMYIQYCWRPDGTVYTDAGPVSLTGPTATGATFSATCTDPGQVTSPGEVNGFLIPAPVLVVPMSCTGSAPGSGTVTFPLTLVTSHVEGVTDEIGAFCTTTGCDLLP